MARSTKLKTMKRTSIRERDIDLPTGLSQLQTPIPLLPERRFETEMLLTRRPSTTGVLPLKPATTPLRLVRLSSSRAA